VTVLLPATPLSAASSGRARPVDDIPLDIRRRQQLVEQKAVLFQQRFKLTVGKCRTHRFTARFGHHDRVLHTPHRRGEEPLVRIVEHEHAAVRAKRGQLGKRFVDRFGRKIVGHPEPREKSLRGRIEAGGGQALRQAVFGKVRGDERQAGRGRAAGKGRTASLDRSCG